MAQRTYANASFIDLLMIQPRLYQTFDQQFPPLPYPFEFLEQPYRSFLWFSDQWYAPWITVALYLLVVKALVEVTKILPKRKYTLLTFVHNASVAIESAFILWMFGKETIKYLRTNGLGYWGLYCDPHHMLDAESNFRFYQSLFYLNKYHELFDTVVLTLRGSKPSFLALFHHTVMLGVTFYNRWPYLAPVGWLSVALNLAVHVVMYSYFALHAVGVNLSSLRIWITRAQILQFFVILIHALPWPYFRYTHNCLGSISSWAWVAAPVAFINFLFIKFYMQQYLEESSGKQKAE